MVLDSCAARKCTSVRENVPENYLSDTITALKSRQERLDPISFYRTPPEHHYRVPQSLEQSEGRPVQSRSLHSPPPSVGELRPPNPSPLRFGGAERNGGLRPPINGGLRRTNSTWETKGPEVLYRNPVIEGPDPKSELVGVTIERTYVLPDARVHPIFLTRIMNPNDRLSAAYLQQQSLCPPRLLNSRYTELSLCVFAKSAVDSNKAFSDGSRKNNPSARRSKWIPVSWSNPAMRSSSPLSGRLILK